MTPFLSSSLFVRSSIRREIHKRARASEVALAVQSIIEEFGDNFDGIRAVLDRLETRGDLAPGLWETLVQKLEGAEPQQDWETALRSVAGSH